MASKTNGWTVTQWREAQIKSGRYAAIKRLLDIGNFNSLENAWASLASEREITSSWDHINQLENAKNLPLFGVPFSVRHDVTAEASAEEGDRNHDLVVELLRNSGAIVIGKTNTVCVEEKGVCGSALAVARGVVPFAVGVHNAGLIPEHLQNLISLKLSWDVLNLKCAPADSQSDKSISVFTWALSDIQLIYSTISTTDKTFTRKVQRTFGIHPKFAVPEDCSYLNLGPLETVKELGIDVVPKDFSNLYKLISCLQEGPKVPEKYIEYMKNLSQDMEPSVLEILSHAEHFTTSKLVNSIRREMQKTFANNLFDLDGFIIPIVPVDSSTSDEADHHRGIYSGFVNLSDLSALSIPAGACHNGVPFGLALISRKFNEHALLEIAMRFLTTQGLITVPPVQQDRDSFIQNVSFNKSLSQTDMAKSLHWMRKPEAPLSKPTKPFQTVLIANRGEIAVRIIRTLKRLGIKSVVVFSEQDRFSQHVLDADESVYLEGETLPDTYLNINRIIAAAKNTNSEAIIPGYGFLSENAEFSEACKNSGVVFVGPSADAIRSLGLKHSAREIAMRAKVPLVPGSGLLNNLEQAIEIAENLGYPIMVKSTAGGGGIGLQRVDNRDELIKAYESVRRLGQSYFNDSGVFLERFVDNARHIEVQIFGDGNGNAIGLGERDCSLQRRNQKVIEETPAPNLSTETGMKIRTAAVMLAKTMKYKCAGTVEFIYDEERDEFYFLEVNTRLQVEHPVTEEVLGLDLVEWMLLIAADTPPDFSAPIHFNGASMEARLYAENPVKGFLPSPGLLTDVIFPTYARVDTWIKKGTDVTADFDPLLAKIIVHGQDRAEALEKLCRALDDTVIDGIVTNIDYLRSIARSEMFKAAAVSTKVLDSFTYTPQAIEIMIPGSYTTVQDHPGRTGLWHIGVPPSGPMDDYAFRLANRIVGNHPTVPALEITLMGPTILFHSATIVAITGGSCDAKLDGISVECWKPIHVKATQKLSVGKLTSGCRAYLAIRGGLDVPIYLGSRSTFALGNMGGFNGRVLKFGDVIFLGRCDVRSCTIPAPIYDPTPVPSTLIPTYPKTWEVGVLSGPHGSPDFFTPECIQTFLTSEWKVHYNSNRFGVRLIGPKPDWARIDGGEAGLHPSNTHDYVYGLGAVNFTGDDPVILTCDGPSLGGFVCPFTVAEAEMWKIGQLKPGDSLTFKTISFDYALQLKARQDRNIESASGSLPDEIPFTEIASPVLYCKDKHDLNPRIAYRQGGDRYVLIEYGENIFDILVTYRIYKLMELVNSRQIDGIIELSPGVRSVLIQYDGHILSQDRLIQILSNVEQELVITEKWQVKSRKVRLPLAFEDRATLAAVDRYRETIRADAPWLPNNVDFIKKINHFEHRNAVADMLYSAKFLVLGLGDVFLGAPCAVPLDPRQRLVGTKYNPSRTFTPNGTVGIGGMYMCIYTMESPGGYQLVGGTVPIWDKLTLGQDRPWLLSLFDQIEFYPVSQECLEKLTTDAKHGNFKFDITECVFDYASYKQWLDDHAAEIAAYNSKLMEGTEEMAQLIKVANVQCATTESRTDEDQDDFGTDVTPVYCEFVGRVWKQLVNVGDVVKMGQELIVVEAMKAEMVVTAPKDSKVLKVTVRCGDFVEGGDVVVILE